jgi:hypothetical protein
MARRPRMVELKSSVSGMIDDGLSELQSLGEEMRSWYDNLTDSLQQNDKGTRVGEAADALENLATEVEVPEGAAEAEVVLHHRPLGRKQSRARRRDHAVAMLSAAKDKLEELKDHEDNEDGDDDFDTPIDELDNIISEAEGVEFPGMYG